MSSFAFAEVPSAILNIKVAGIREAAGDLLVSIYDDATAFPDDASKSAYVVKVPVKYSEMYIHVSNLPPGDYAIAVLHDKNSNGKMDKNALGMPKEDFGFSNDAMGTFGPPSFDRAKIHVIAPSTDTVINLKHI